jgi:hypothetical protein
MLLVADLFSLWLCCDCPTNGERGTILGQSAMKLQTDVLFNQVQFSVSEFAIQQAPDSGRLESLNWAVGVQPYRFHAAPLELSVPAIVAPAVPYQSWEELKAACWPIELRWRILRQRPAFDSVN